MKKTLLGGAAGVALALALAGAAMAQETTAAVRGRVTDDQGAPIAGSTVVVTHLPTGASTTITTGPDGYFSARGLRVGGPYRVRATASGYNDQSAEITQIGVGSTEEVDLEVHGGPGSVSELVVTAAAVRTPQAFQEGPTSNFSAARIEALPSISRDLKDIARIDPFAVIQDPDNQDALSFAGANTRFNQLTIDGIRQNDDFGLNNNGYPTQRSPISIEVIQSLQVSAAPFDVLNNGFLGGSINAVTKSGSNTFHGSLYGEYTGDSLRGDSIRGAPINSPFSEKTWGATLGGPIIRDRLFFFGGYEKFQSTFHLDEGPVDSGKSTLIPRITSGAVDTFEQATQSIYDYDPGAWVDGAPPVEDEKIFGKLDWNINDRHRAAFTFQQTTGNSFNGSVSSSFASGDSVSTPAIGLESRQYNKSEKLTSYNLQVNSDWTQDFSTELRLGHKETETSQLPIVGGLDVGTVSVVVNDLPGVQAGPGNATINFGPDNFRHDNYLDVKTDTAELIGRYRLGAHELTAGARIEHQDIFNVFVARSLGDWVFASYQDYLNRTATRFSLTGAVDPDGGTVPATLGTARDGAAAFDYNLFSVYGEDSWQATDAMRLLFGLRYDGFQMSDRPSLNAGFVSRNGFANNANLDGKGILLPRFAFNFRPDNHWDVSGGIGRFSSQGLNVWISDPFANDGVRQTNAVCPAGPYLNVDLKTAPAGCTFTPGNGNTNALDPALRIPAAWKFNLSAGYNFDLGRWGGDGWRAQADVIYAIYQDQLLWKDLRSEQIGTAPDGRPIYGRTSNGTIGANQYDLLLTNGGPDTKSEALALTLRKAWNEGWFEGLSVQGTYTHTHATDLNPMTSSIALSSYTRFATADPQNPDPATSDYEIKNRFAVTVDWRHRFFGDNETGFTMFAQRRSGLPFSYTFANTNNSDFNFTYDDVFGNTVSSYSGRQASSNQLFYVPKTDASGQVTATSDPRVQYSNVDLAAFNQFLKSSGLIDYAGGVAPRNAFHSHDVTTIDIRVSQELPAFFPGGAKVLAYMDIENFGNLLNDKWGVLDQYDFYRGVPVLKPQIVGDHYVYSGDPSGNVLTKAPFTVTGASLWQIKFGLKYSF